MSRPRHRRMRGGMVAAVVVAMVCWCLRADVAPNLLNERLAFDDVLSGNGTDVDAYVAPERETHGEHMTNELVQDDITDRDQSIRQHTESDEASPGESPNGGVTMSTCEGEVEQVATRLLTSYRDEGDCVLSQAGYLDLFGEVWGCVVYGGTWADVCIVRSSADGHSCEVRVAHLNADLVAPLVSDE